MEPRTTPFEYVFASAARRETLATLAANPVDRRTVVDRLEASESAVYDAFSGLAERGLIVRNGNRWAVTGTGRAVADCIERARRVDATLLEDPPFWRAHDLACLPREIRTAVMVASKRRLADGGGDWAPVDVLVAHLEETRPERVDAVVLGEHRSLLERVERVLEVRTVGERSVVARDRSRDDEGRQSPTEVEDESIPTHASDFESPSATLLVTDADVAVTLPALEERYAEDGVIVVGGEAVRTRCRAYVDRLWARATPSEDASSIVRY